MPWKRPFLQSDRQNRHRRVLGALTLAAVVGLVYPYAERAWKCRVGGFESEACTWARAYFPLSRWIEPAIVTPIVFLLIWLVFALADRVRRNR